MAVDTRSLLPKPNMTANPLQFHHHNKNSYYHLFFASGGCDAIITGMPLHSYGNAALWDIMKQ